MENKMRKDIDIVKNFGKFINEDLDINKFDKEIKKEIQNLRTELNLYKKCLGKIYFDIDHLKKGSYDYGEAAEGLLSDIKAEINNVNYEVRDLKRAKENF